MRRRRLRVTRAWFPDQINLTEPLGDSRVIDTRPGRVLASLAGREIDPRRPRYQPGGRCSPVALSLTVLPSRTPRHGRRFRRQPRGAPQDAAIHNHGGNDETRLTPRPTRRVAILAAAAL